MTERTILRLKWLQIRTRSSDNNYHGPNRETLRNTWTLVRMGSFSMIWSLYCYDGAGRSRTIEVAFPLWRGKWSPGIVAPKRHRKPEVTDTAPDAA